MSGESTDRRVKKTRQHLRDALVELLAEKELKDITISELTELADVNRGTFYLHYKDIYDLYDRMESEVCDELVSIVKRHMEQNKQRKLMPVMLDILQFCRTNAQLCIILLRSGDGRFFNSLLESVKPSTEAEWLGLLGSTEPSLREYYYAYITSGFIGLLKSWFMSGMKESPKEMAALASRMLPAADSAGAV